MPIAGTCRTSCPPKDISPKMLLWATHQSRNAYPVSPCTTLTRAMMTPYDGFAPKYARGNDGTRLIQLFCSFFAALSADAAHAVERHADERAQSVVSDM